MIKEFLESLKLKDIVFFVLIIVLFCMYFKKNNKEKFSLDLSTTDKLKEQMAIALGDNFTAIKNLGDLASQITSSSAPGKLKLNELVINDGSGDYDILERIKSILDTNVTQGGAILNANAKIENLDSKKQDKGNYIKFEDDIKLFSVGGKELSASGAHVKTSFFGTGYSTTGFQNKMADWRYYLGQPSYDTRWYKWRIRKF